MIPIELEVDSNLDRWRYHELALSVQCKQLATQINIYRQLDDARVPSPQVVWALDSVHILPSLVCPIRTNKDLLLHEQLRPPPTDLVLRIYGIEEQARQDAPVQQLVLFSSFPSPPSARIRTTLHYITTNY